MTQPRSCTQSRESEADVDTIVAYLADPQHIPIWAPAFADAVEPSGPSTWKLSKDGKAFSLRLVVAPDLGIIDYLREIVPGRAGGAYIRVVPRLGGGSVIVMTLPVPPTTNSATVSATLTLELDALAGQAVAR